MRMHPEAQQPGRAKEFAALQQHIDDLTQHKFEVQRGLAAQQRVAQELSEENKTLTEDFNRQVHSSCCMLDMTLMS